MKIKMKVTSIYLEESLLNSLKDLSDKTPGMTTNSLIRKILKDGLKKLKKIKPESI